MPTAAFPHQYLSGRDNIRLESTRGWGMRRFSWYLFFLILQCALVASVAAREVQDGTAPSGCVVSDRIANIRPDPKGPPTKVSVQIFVIDIQSVDNVKQQFTADFTLGLAWKDPRLIDTPGDSALIVCKLGLNEVWDPKIQILNRRDAHKRWPEVVEVYADGTVVYVQRFYGTFGAPFDLHSFPFDRQVLPISVVSIPDVDEVEFVIVEADRAETFSIADWSIGQGKSDLEVLQVADGLLRGGEQVHLPRLNYQFAVQRHTSYYMWKVMGPLAIIIFMSWAVFWIDPTQIGVQVGIATTAILTLIAFLFSLEARLPRISYLTRIDYFIFGSLTLVFLAFLQAIVTCSLGFQGNIALARRIDVWSRWVFPLSFVLVGIFVLW